MMNYPYVYVQAVPMGKIQEGVSNAFDAPEQPLLLGVAAHTVTVWLADAMGLLRALRMGPEAARWMSDGDHPLVGDPEDGCLMWTERGLPEIGAPPGAVLEVLLGERPRLRATDLGAWIEQVSRLYAGAQLEVDSDGWVSPRLPGGEGAH
jgi:hypothetical protein